MRFGAAEWLWLLLLLPLLAGFFFFALRDTAGLSILDLSAASQANISFITNLGHRIYAEDFLDSLDSTFPEEDYFNAQSDAGLAQQVLDQCLNFPVGHFDGALIWDGLQYVAPPLLTGVEALVPVALAKAGEFIAELRTGKANPLELVVRRHISREADEYTNNNVSAVVAKALEEAGMSLAAEAGSDVQFFETRENAVASQHFGEISPAIFAAGRHIRDVHEAITA